MRQQRLLASLTEPEYSTDWECYQGKRIRSHLYRTKEMAGYLDWEHLEQAWRIEKEILHPDGQRECEQPDRVTNLPWGRLKAAQILHLVRAHWGIEDNCYWSLDVLWGEDTKPWGTKNLSLQVLGLLRLMAYNLVALLRCRYLRRRDQRPWQEWFEFLFLLLCGESVQRQTPARHGS